MRFLPEHLRNWITANIHSAMMMDISVMIQCPKSP